LLLVVQEAQLEQLTLVVLMVLMVVFLLLALVVFVLLMYVLGPVARVQAGKPLAMLIMAVAAAELVAEVIGAAI
jgi:hypothetical protein